MPHDRPPRIATARVDAPPTHIVALAGEHDLSTAQDVGAAIERALRTGDAVLVDLSLVTFAESAILGALLAAHRGADDGQLAVVIRPGTQVDRLLDLVDARSILLTYATREAALGSLHDGTGAERLQD